MLRIEFGESLLQHLLGILAQSVVGFYYSLGHMRIWGFLDN
jgi:hypothetical protein